MRNSQTVKETTAKQPLYKVCNLVVFHWYRAPYHTCTIVRMNCNCVIILLIIYYSTLLYYIYIELSFVSLIVSGRVSEITDVDNSLQSIATPSLITATCNLLNNLIFIGQHEVVRQIYEYSIDKHLFGYVEICIILNYFFFTFLLSHLIFCFKMFD